MVTASGNQQWYFRQGVSLENLSSLAEQIGEEYQSDTISKENAGAGIDPPVANRLATDQATDGFLQQAGNGGGRYSGGGLAPREGAPTVSGATGPNLRLVAVAEQYAAANGIELRRQT